MSIKKHLVMGPGGRGCACCFPGPGSKGRYWKYRCAKKKQKREDMEIEQEQLTDD